MGSRKNKQPADNSAGNFFKSPAPVGEIPYKRCKQGDADPAMLNQQLLGNNKFAPLKGAKEIPTAPMGNRQSTKETPKSGGDIPKRVKLPPIFTTSKDVATLRTELAANAVHPFFKLCSQGTKIICSTDADYKAVGEHLKGKCHEFYTHDAPGTKPLKVMIHGLPEYSKEEVIAELVAANLKPLDVFPIRRNEEGSYRDQLYLVHLEKGSVTMSDLRKTRALFQVIVEWERYRPKKRDVTQCGNCLALGHGARNCHMKPRCGKCAGGHLTSACQPMEEEIPPKCVNCGAEHEGSSRACPKRAEFLEIRKRASAKNQRGRNRRDPPPPPLAYEENFPRYRHTVPNLKPLEPHRQPNRTQPPAPDRPSVQPRLAAAAATASASYSPPPGWGNHERRSPTPTDWQDDDPPYPVEVMIELGVSMLKALRRGRNRDEQLDAMAATIVAFNRKYGP